MARAIEALSLRPRRPETSDASTARAIRAARSCYDHLAGALGVAVTEALRGRGWIDGWEAGFSRTAAGRDGFPQLGIDLDALLLGRRPLTRSCLDWSERRPHLAGALGAGLATHFLEASWVVRVRHSRAVRLTDRGRRALHDALGVTL